MPTHREERVLPYTAQQIYDLVADVERYPEFLPWTAAARIRSRRRQADGSEVLDTDLVISFKVFRERFTTRVTMRPDTGDIRIEYLDGPFRHMRSDWSITDLPDKRCQVRFFVDFEFRNLVLQKLIGLVFDEAMRRVVRAFEARAAALYGRSPTG
jgi:coenzyme Q-binding protein COQ10